MAAARREVGEERLLRVLGAHAVEPLDRLVGHGIREVVGVFLVVELRRRADDLLVLRQARVPLAGVAAEEAVEVVEAPAVRPAVEGPGRALLAVGRQVPLPEGGRAVAVVAEDARQRSAVPRQRRGVAREPARELADRAEAHGVVVPPGQQRRPGRRAQRRDVEAVVAKALLGQARVVRRADGTAERGRVPEARVVDEDEQHVRGAVRRRRVPDQVPVGLRTLERPVCYPLKRRPLDRECGAVDLCHREPPVFGAVASPSDSDSARDPSSHSMVRGVLVKLLFIRMGVRLQVEDDLLDRAGEGVRSLRLIGEVGDEAVVAADVHA